MFLEFLKIFLKNKKLILYKKTKYSEFVQNELLYYIFSYFLVNNFFLNFETLIKYILFYKKNIYFLFEEFANTSNFININQSKKYISNNFSKSFPFYSRYMLISKIRNLIIRKINPILCMCIQFEYLFKKKVKFSSIFSNKIFLCNFCVYKRTGNAYKFRKIYSIIKKIKNYKCFLTTPLTKQRYDTIVGQFLIITFQLKINFQDEWLFKMHHTKSGMNFQNLFENFFKKNSIYEKKFIYFEDFLILSEIKIQKKKNAMYINFKLSKTCVYLTTKSNRSYVDMEQLFNSLISLSLCKKLKLGCFIWKIQKNITGNQILTILKKIFIKEIKYKIKRKLILKKNTIVKSFKQNYTNILQKIYFFFYLKIFINKSSNKILYRIEQTSNIIQQLHSKNKKIKNVLLLLQEFNLIEKTKINHKIVKKFDSKMFDTNIQKKNDTLMKSARNKKYKNHINIGCLAIQFSSLFKVLFQKNNEFKNNDRSSTLKKTSQLKLSKLKLLRLFIFIFKTRKFHSVLISKIIECDIIFTMSMFLKKKNLSKNKLYVKFIKKMFEKKCLKKNFDCQIHKFFFSKTDLCIFYRIEALIPYKSRLIYIKKKFFFNISIIQIFLQNLLELQMSTFKTSLEYLKRFFQLKIIYAFVSKDPSCRKIKKTFMNKILKGKLKFSFNRIKKC
nr:hypothetical protein CparaKRNrm1_p007 [Cryptomonas paramecium]